MIKLWDRYGIWITAYVLLVMYTQSPPPQDNHPDKLVLNLFLNFNLTLTLATFYRLLIRHWTWFTIWGPLLSRWIARWVGYTVIGLILGGFVFSVFGLILAPVVAILITIFHIVDDVQGQLPATRP